MATISSYLLNTWQHKGGLGAVLWPLACLHQGLLGLRRITYRLGWKHSTRLPVPVIVVGNVVVGGAGKTPTAIALLHHLQQQGWQPGLISRGYGRTENPDQPCTEVTTDSSSQTVGDEPLLIRRCTQVPVVVGRQRVQAGQFLLQQHPEVDILVCDDGMQHWALARDITIVVFDERGMGNGWLLPAGLLREPWPREPWGNGAWLALRTTRPKATLCPLPMPKGHNKVHLAHRGLASQAMNARGQCLSLTQLCSDRSKPLAALAGIAQPERFFDMLRTLNVPITHTQHLVDHADATALLVATQQAPTYRWLCTEKDAVKLFPLLHNHPELDVWSVALEQTPPAEFWTEFDQLLQKLPKPLSSAHGCQIT